MTPEMTPQYIRRECLAAVGCSYATCIQVAGKLAAFVLEVDGDDDRYTRLDAVKLAAKAAPVVTDALATARAYETFIETGTTPPATP